MGRECASGAGFDHLQTMAPDLDKEKVMQSYERYLGFTASHIPTYKEFVMNMEEKLQDDEFLADTDMILGPGVVYDAAEAWKKVHDELVSRLMRPDDRR